MKVKPNHDSCSIWKCRPPSGQKYTGAMSVFHEEHQSISGPGSLYFLCLVPLKLEMKVKSIHHSSSTWKCEPPSGQALKWFFRSKQVTVYRDICSIWKLIYWSVIMTHSYTYFHVEVNITMIWRWIHSQNFKTESMEVRQCSIKARPTSIKSEQCSMKTRLSSMKSNLSSIFSKPSSILIF